MRCLDPMCIIHCPPIPLMCYLSLRSPVEPLPIEFTQHAHHIQPCTDRCMSIETIGMLKKPSSAGRTRADDWRRKELERQIQKYKEPRPTVCTGVADSINREFKRQLLEYELERMNAPTRATDSSPSQASTHRSLLVHSVHMPPAGPSDTERGMGRWDVHLDQEDAAGSPPTYSRPPDLQAYENHELRPDT